ncbi:hypothetical protein BT96DRAFT_929343, partial [Gymnopus androsaceus JB14]
PNAWDTASKEYYLGWYQVPQALTVCGKVTLDSSVFLSSKFRCEADAEGCYIDVYSSHSIEECLDWIETQKNEHHIVTVAGFTNTISLRFQSPECGTCAGTHRGTCPFDEYLRNHFAKPLPNELINHILENLYFDKATLKKCALVGKAWAHASQRGLFETIVLYDRMKTKLERLLAIFDENPYLASVVRCLTVNFCSEDASPWAAQVIQRLSKVKHVLLDSCAQNMLSDFPLLREALYDIFSIPSLTRVTIEHCRFSNFVELASLLSHATYLKVLAVESMYCADTDLPLSSDLIPNLPPRSIKLDEFVVTTSAFMSLIPWFKQETCPFDVQDLQFLHARLASTPRLRVSADFLVQRAGHSLTKLELEYQYGIEECGFHLGHLPNLDSFMLDNHQSTDRANDIIPWMQSFFKPLNLDGHPLRHFTLIILVPSANSAQWESECDQYAILDILFAKPVFESLAMVNIVLKGDDVSSAFEEALEEKLSLLKGSGKLLLRQSQYRAFFDYTSRR